MVLVRQLLESSLVKVYIDDEGKEAYRLTEQGARVGRQLAV
jgi:hypothetical protein